MSSDISTTENSGNDTSVGQKKSVGSDNLGAQGDEGNSDSSSEEHQNASEVVDETDIEDTTVPVLAQEVEVKTEDGDVISAQSSDDSRGKPFVPGALSQYTDGTVNDSEVGELLEDDRNKGGHRKGRPPELLLHKAKYFRITRASRRVYGENGGKEKL